MVIDTLPLTLMRDALMGHVLMRDVLMKDVLMGHGRMSHLHGGIEKCQGVAKEELHMVAVICNKHMANEMGVSISCMHLVIVADQPNM